MITKHLKMIRKVVSLVALLLISIIFLDLYGILSHKLVAVILYFQFIPSILKFSVYTGVGATGFIVVLLITIFAGRVYCSFLCPLGTSIDLISRVSGNKLSRKMAFTVPHNSLRYMILFLTVVSFVFGTMGFINLLDPYSNFGRIMSVMIKSFFVVLNNILSRLLEWVDIYTISPYVQPGFSLTVILSVVVFAGIVIWMSAKKGRLYCNTLCPVGALLGIVSKWSFLKLGIDPGSCTGCKKCERVCKAACIDSKHSYIDVSRCVCCYNCLDHCSEGSISFIRKRQYNMAGGERGFDPQRRTLMVILVFLFTGLPKIAAAISKPLVYVKNKIPVIRKCPITPPGSKSIEHFTGKCTACYLCVTACPGKVIQPDLAGFGTAGLLMPGMMNRKGFCNFNCTICGEVCPTGAISPVDGETKKQIQIGKVVFIKENCIVITQKTECGACSEHCPTKAVSMVVENNLRVPSVNPNICVGCGACEYACPSIPHKSIYVEGNSVHLIAKKPKVKKLMVPSPDSDFPF